MLGFAAGDVYWTVALADDATTPYPSLSDAGYLSIFPASFAGLVLLLRARANKLSRALWLDGLVCALSGAAVGAALVLGVVASTEGSFAAVATNLAYPLGDLMMLAFVIAVLVFTGRAGGSTWWLLASAFAVWAIGDGIYLYQAAVGTYVEYTLLDTTWPLASRAGRARRDAPGRPAGHAAPARRHAGRARRVHADRARPAGRRPLRAPQRRRDLAGVAAPSSPRSCASR